jgi:cytidylate kinase
MAWHRRGNTYMSIKNKTKLILIEGIPGSGKTTYANRLYDYLKDKGVGVQKYNEGDLHPVDLSWCAYLTLEEYNNLLKSYPEHNEVLKNNSQVSDDYVVVAYTRLGFYPNENKLMTYLALKEIFDAKLTASEFMSINTKRWHDFAEKQTGREEVNIFECVFLQNNINELLFHQTLDDSTIKKYLNKLVDQATDLNLVLIYLSQPNIDETINKVADTRISEDKTKYKDWIDLVIEYIETSAYGKKNKLQGFDGVIDAMKARKGLELGAINDLPISTLIINNNEYNWDRVFEEIVSRVSEFI